MAGDSRSLVDPREIDLLDKSAGLKTTCPTCGRTLVAPEEKQAHARGVCEGLDVPPPPDLGARIRYARQQEAKGLVLKDLAHKYKQRKAAKRGGKIRAENSKAVLERVRLAALRYRRSDPDTSTRKMAADLAEGLEMPLGTVRDRLRRLRMA